MQRRGVEGKEIIKRKVSLSLSLSLSLSFLLFRSSETGQPSPLDTHAVRPAGLIPSPNNCHFLRSHQIVLKTRPSLSAPFTPHPSHPPPSPPGPIGTHLHIDCESLFYLRGRGVEIVEQDVRRRENLYPRMRGIPVKTRPADGRHP